MNDMIVIKGARQHNLKNIDVKIPRDQLVVITGLSGSGKSSLAFDTIYAEGQRRYVESLSAYARQFLDQQQKPDVDHIEGLSPAISIEQKSTSKNPRSTVGTLTEIYDYLRLLYARIGEAHCYQCGKLIQKQTVQQIVDTCLQMPENTRFMVLSPVVRGRKGEYKKELVQFQKKGFVRAIIDGKMYDLADAPALNKKKVHTIELVIDRLVLKPDIKQRLTDSIELALKSAEGLVTIAQVDGESRLFSEKFSCDTCGVSYSEIQPRLFSFNSPYGACVTCNGLGHAMDFDVQKVVPDVQKSLQDGALLPWAGRWSGYYMAQLQCVAKHLAVSMSTPWAKIPKEARQVLLNGSQEDIHFVYERDGSSYKFKRPFAGVLPMLLSRYKDAGERVRAELAAFMTQRPCSACQGARLKPEALAIRVSGQSIAQVCAMPVGEAQQFFTKLPLSQRDTQIAVRILKEIRDRLAFLQAVGLDYLNLDRSSVTLSGGEAQRIRLATQIGSALQGVLYVLDEPSIGLHQRDNHRLISTLKKLRDVGNTVLVVEHDEDTIRASDYVIDMGPGAGTEGGRVVASGTPLAIEANKKSLTGDYMSGRRFVPVPKKRRPPRAERLWVRGASGNNLKNLDIEFPLGQFICVTGVSGSGKSTLVNDTLYAGLSHALYGSQTSKAMCKSIDGIEHIDKVIDIDQTPIGRTPRSNPATYTQLFGLIRDLFANLPESRARGYAPGRYSFNVKGGRCEACEGDGVLRIEMHFLPDVYVTCDQCHGRRYNRETLDILYKSKSIADILEMTVADATDFLQAIPTIKKKLDTLTEVGLGYIKLGQSATTLSGGEAQRIKLSRELSKRATGRTLYILDEPTTGLHFYDVDKLLKVLHALVDTGNTVVVIEHNLDVIKTADHVIDLGPEGGFNGGQVLGIGTPEHIASLRASYTGKYLKPLLKK